MAQATMSDVKHDHASDRMEFRLYTISVYPIFLVGAIIRRVARLGHRADGPAKARKSIFQEASEGLHSTIPWIFSGR